MNAIIRLFEQRVRGIRLIELVGLVLALAMIFWVCLSKAREGEDIKHMNDLDQQIAEQQQAVDGLKVKVASLERPARLEALAKAYLGMTPVSPTHEAQLDTLGEISKTTSRPVQSAVPIVVAPAATVSPPPVVQNDLISADTNKASLTPPTLKSQKVGGL